MVVDYQKVKEFLKKENPMAGIESAFKLDKNRPVSDIWLMTAEWIDYCEKNKSKAKQTNYETQTKFVESELTNILGLTDWECVVHDECSLFLTYAPQTPTKAELIQKLSKIQPTAFPTMMTMDMGIQYEIMTSKGAYTCFGGMGDWPFFKMDFLNKDEYQKIVDLIGKNKLTCAKLSKIPVFSDFAEYLKENYHDIDLNKVFKNIKNLRPGDTIYMYMDLHDNDEAGFYNNYYDAIEGFISEDDHVTPWNNFNEDELQGYLDLIADKGEGVLFF